MTNILLDELLQKSKEEPKYWNEYFQKLLDLEVIVLASQPISEDFEGEIPLLMISDSANRQVIPLFTDEMHLKSIKGPYNIARLKGIELFKKLKDIAVVVNPNTDFSRIITPFEIKVLTLEYIKRHDKL